ncbi:MAG: regulatory signaling modulator protein AmpE [Gammaproteobacteria bacterium]|nr:regulatory signaling modulator protein AmpE [Gammaproteobacteria bacterium]
MNLIALIIGLLIERLVTHLLHLREPRWMDAYFDWGLARTSGMRVWLEFLSVVGLILIPVLPVLLVAIAFRDALYGAPYLLFAILLLILSLGPRDLQEEVKSFCDARRKGDEGETSRSAKELTESDFPRDPGEREFVVEEAILFQAVNRVFAVVFWFMILGPIGVWGFGVSDLFILGPVGAWMFRVADLFRRRRSFEVARLRENPDQPVYTGAAICWIHGLLIWIPARLLAIGYAIAGSFDGAVSAWRDFAKANRGKMRYYVKTKELLAVVGQGALEEVRGDLDDEDPQVCSARAAIRLVQRALFVWVFAIAVFTLLGWAV